MLHKTSNMTAVIEVGSEASGWCVAHSTLLLFFIIKCSIARFLCAVHV